MKVKSTLRIFLVLCFMVVGLAMLAAPSLLSMSVSPQTEVSAVEVVTDGTQAENEGESGSIEIKDGPYQFRPNTDADTQNILLAIGLSTLAATVVIIITAAIAKSKKRNRNS